MKFKKQFLLDTQDKFVFLSIGVLIFIIKVVSDFTFLVFNAYHISSQTILAQLFSIILILLTGLIVSKFVKDSFSILSENPGQEFIEDDFKIMIMNLSVLIFVSIFGKSDYESIDELSFTVFIIHELFYFVCLAVFAFNFHFFFKWIFIRRHKRTIQFTTIVISLIVIIVMLNVFFVFSIEKTKPVISVLSVLLIIQTAIFTWFLIGKNHWIHALSRKYKLKLTFISIISFIAGINLLSALSDTEFTIFALSERIFPGLTWVMFSSVFLLVIKNAKLLLISLMSLPSSSIMERRSSEISSLTYLNKLVADSIERDDSTLIDTVTKLAVSSIGASGGWSEIYKGERIEIRTTVNCVPDIILRIIDESGLSHFHKNIFYPKLINNIEELIELRSLKQYMPVVNSMVIIPLSTSNERVGTMVIFDVNEYGFEKEDLLLLNAFSDNIKIALDNNNLLKSSLDKERYKNELLLARDMQQKLLPNKLPQPQNYLLNAFAIPAAEVGGDYYDVVYLKDGRQCILSGDVSGKGISAAFIMAQLKGVVISVAGEVSDVVNLMKKINKILYGQLGKKMFITLSALKIHDSLGSVTIARAGHTPFYIKRMNEVVTILPQGIGIGLADSELFDMSIETINIKLLPGDSIIMLTDGVNELRKGSGEEIGLSGITDFISLPDIDISSFNKDNFLQQIEQKFGIIKQIDDITLVSLTFLPNSV